LQRVATLFYPDLILLFSLEKDIIVIKHSNVYLGLVTPSGGWWSPIEPGTKSLGPGFVWISDGEKRYSNNEPDVASKRTLRQPKSFIFASWEQYYKTFSVRNLQTFM